MQDKSNEKIFKDQTENHCFVSELSSSPKILKYIMKRERFSLLQGQLI